MLDRSKMTDSGPIRMRPSFQGDTTCVVRDKLIQGLVDKKGVFITCTHEIPGNKYESYSSVVIQNVDVGHISRSAEAGGLHLDTIFVQGVNRRKHPGTPDLIVRLTDVYCHDTGGREVAFLFKDGAIEHLTLQRVAVERHIHPLTIWTTVDNPVQEVLIDECPGLRVVFQGNGWSTVSIRNSPDVKVEAAKDQHGVKPELEYNWLEAGPEPEPSVAEQALKARIAALEQEQSDLHRRFDRIRDELPERRESD